jgi:signal transduction histidine kinase
MVKPWQLIMPGKVNADASLIQHVITNLLANAIRFTQHAEEAEINIDIGDKATIDRRVISF